MRKRPKHIIPLSLIEPMENRRLMSSVSLSQGVLSITGDADSPNTIDVSLSSNRMQIVTTTNGTTRSFSALSVRSIRITGGNTNDAITVSSSILLPATLDGAAGNDILRGGGGMDSITGGTGADWIDGGPGMDRTDGGPDDDTYVGALLDTPVQGTGDYIIRASPRFNLYDATLFSNKPDTTQYGMKGILLASSQFFANGDNSKPDEAATRAYAQSVANLGKPVVIDIENWPVDIRTASEAEVNDSIVKLSQIADWMHSAAPNLKLGFYGIMPLRDYFTPLQYSSDPAAYQSQYTAWQAANDKLKPLAAKVDYIFPSLYTFYDNQADWKIYATANIAEAKRYGKPVLPFLWMQYHESNPTLSGQFIPRDYWQLQLDTVRRQADGVVVWGGWQAPWPGTSSSGASSDWLKLSIEFVRREQAAM